jgi:hypothetical protein
LECARQPLGLGYEIKARDILRGSGFWRSHEDERNKIREIFLTAPKKYSGISFVSIINKKALKKQYSTPADPYLLCLEFIFERLQMFLFDIDDYGIIIYDQNKTLENTLHDTAISLVREGSLLIYFSKILNELVIKHFKIDRIVEFSLGRSENSIGLQIADFFSTMTYAYVKEGKPSSCIWWEKLESSLYKKDGKLLGFGYKEFP